MKINSTIIHPILPQGMTAFDVAQTHYRKWQGLTTFEDDVVEYLKKGFVVARPTCFAMGKIINLAEREGEPPDLAWFIRIAVGDIMELFDTLPGYLPKLAFCRHGSGKLRVYPTKRVAKLAAAIKEKNYGLLT